MSKHNKRVFAQDARTVMLGRGPIEDSMIQQMFYKCISDKYSDKQDTQNNIKKSSLDESYHLKKLD